MQTRGKTRLHCSNCNGPTAVRETYSKDSPRTRLPIHLPDGAIVRKRQCVNCGTKFLTEERVVYQYE